MKVAQIKLKLKKILIQVKEGHALKKLEVISSRAKALTKNTQDLAISTKPIEI